jgi:hypothetical protein
MLVHVFVFLLVVCLLSLALLWRLCRFHLRPSSSRGGAIHSRAHRLLKPRCPDDCPACRLACTSSLAGGPAPADVASLARGEKPAGSTQASQNCRLRLSQSAMPLLWDHRCPHPRAGGRWQAWSCRADSDLSRSCLPHHVHFQAQYCAVPSENPLAADRLVLSALAEGLDASAAERVFGYRQATITTWLTRAGSHAQTLHERFFRHLRIPHLQLAELRTRLCCAKQILWLWLAIDPCTKLLPVLHLGPRTQHMAHTVILPC